MWPCHLHACPHVHKGQVLDLAIHELDVCMYMYVCMCLYNQVLSLHKEVLYAKEWIFFSSLKEVTRVSSLQDFFQIQL